MPCLVPLATAERMKSHIRQIVISEMKIAAAPIFKKKFVKYSMVKSPLVLKRFYHGNFRKEHFAYE